MAKKKRRAPPAAPQRTNKRWLAAIALLVGVIAVVAFVRSRGDSKTRRATPAEPDDEPTSSAAGKGTAMAELSRAAWEAGAPSSTSSDDSKWRSRMEQTRAALLQKWRYPPESQPLAGKTDLIPPHFVPPTVRPLSKGNEAGKKGKVIIKQSQDRLFMSAGERGMVSIEATVDGARVPFVIARADVLLAKTDSRDPPKKAGTVAFTDDGVAPDEVAGDNVLSASVPPSLDMVKGFSGEITVSVDVSANGETGTVELRFGQAANEPARFTQNIRESLEAGSLAFYVGVEVYTAGRYNVHARLFDSKDQPIAMMTFVDEVTKDTREIRLLAYGKLLRDTNAVPPFVVKDVEGWRYTIGSTPDRELMVMWPCNYRTSSYDPSQFTNADWDDPMKQARLKLIDDNLKNGPSEIAPVDSNGIPLPPKPLNLPPDPNPIPASAMPPPPPPPTSGKK